LFVYYKFNINYIILTVIDPRHKMQYYIDNEFEKEYITTYKKQITELWTTKYKPTVNENDNQSNIKQNALTAHMFKKRKTAYNDELEGYLNEKPVNFDINVLDFWKVNLIILL